jgi:hypothetical protein
MVVLVEINNKPKYVLAFSLKNISQTIPFLHTKVYTQIYIPIKTLYIKPTSVMI